MKNILMITALMLTGCATGMRSVDDLKTTGVVNTFTVDQNYQQAYRNFKFSFHKCVAKAGLWQLSSTLDADLYTDIEEGRMVMSMVTQFGQPKPIRFIVIKNINSQQSKIAVYQAVKFVSNVEPVYRRWANGDPVCE